MKRYATLILVGIAAPAWAQTTRDTYRIPYKAWMSTAPALEQEASAPPATFPEQVRASSDNSQIFFAARAAYLASAQPDATAQTAWASKPLATAETLLTTPANVDQLLAVTAAKVGSSISTLAGVPDPAIRRFRQALERERAALKALTDSLNARKAPLAELIDNSDEAEIQRASAFQTLNAANARRSQLAEHVKREATDWPVYYKDLLEGGTSGTRSLSSSAATTPGAPAPAKILRPPSGQISLTRYTGEWLFPAKGLFYGPQPESVEMSIEVNDGRLTGTLSAKFLIPTGTMKFDFQGAVQQGRSQSFPLQTSDENMGTIELIPGSAINLLEVNFQTPSTTGNFILVKK